MAIETGVPAKPARPARQSEDGPDLLTQGRQLLAGLGGGASGKISSRDRMFFTERLSLMLDMGIPLHLALESLAAQTPNGTMRTLLTTLNEDVQAGGTFARALQNHPETFSPTYVHLIAAAEQGGFLPTALDRLRDMEERREELRATLGSAVTYPIVLLVFSLAVIVFVLVVVFPKFGDLFAAIHDQLPATTRWLMAASDVLREAWIPLLAGLAVVLLGAERWAKTPAGRAALDRFMLGTPGLRTIAVQLNVVQLLRTMSLSIEHGVAVVDALKSARDVLPSSHFRHFTRSVEAGIAEGRTLTHGFQADPLVPDLVKQMVATGEESGNIAPVMARLADFYEREWKRALEMIAKIAEPAMLLVMGCMVGLIVSSLILPIFKLSRAVH